jgi:hypothetical protein
LILDFGFGVTDAFGLLDLFPCPLPSLWRQSFAIQGATMPRTMTAVAVLMMLMTLGMAQTSPFAGKWKIKLVPDDDAKAAKEKESDDTLVFTATTVAAEKFNAAHGFKPTSYEQDSRRIGPAVFNAEAKSDTAGTAKWAGTMTAATIQGTLKWTKKDGTELTFTYTGEKVGT